MPTNREAQGEVERIVAGLTEAQRAVLMTHKRPYDWRWCTISARDGNSWARAGLPMLKAGLLAWHPNKRETATSLTPLGLRVRQALQTQEPDHG